MAALPDAVIGPLWSAFEGLLMEAFPVGDAKPHPLGCHRRKIPDRIVFERLVFMLVAAVSFRAMGDHVVSEKTLRNRRKLWVEAGIFTKLERLVLDVYDDIVGLDLANLSVDGCHGKAPLGGEIAGRSPVDRAKGGMKRSNMVDGNGVPLGTVVATGNSHDSPLLGSTLVLLEPLQDRLPAIVTVHLDAGYDSIKTRTMLNLMGYHYDISQKGVPLQTGARWLVERLNAWQNLGYRKLAYMTERTHQNATAWVSFANAIITLKRLIATLGRR